MPTGVPLTHELELQVVESYLKAPTTLAKVGKQFGLCSPTIIKILNKHNVPRYKKAKIFSPDLNEDFFNAINTEEKAYYLGLLITDGNVFVPSKGQPSISITQSEQDEYILTRFLESLKSKTKTTHDGRGTAMAAVRSEKLAKDLEKYGVVPNKTLTSYLPLLEDNLMPHLIRGILDGDGSITSTVSSKGKPIHAFSFCGTHRLMNDLAEFLSERLNIKKPKVYDYSDRHLSEVKWQSINDCKVLGAYLYSNATIFLERKKDKYLDILNRYE